MDGRSRTDALLHVRGEEHGGLAPLEELIRVRRVFLHRSRHYVCLTQQPPSEFYDTLRQMRVKLQTI